MIEQQRPSPPLELDSSAAEVWRSTVEALPIGWFGVETWPLLMLYCQYVVLGQRMMATMPDPTDQELMMTLSRIVRMVTSLAMQLRLTPRVRHELRLHSTQRTELLSLTRPNTERPWEDDLHDEPATH
jgi:phage terminase small subunit